MAAKNPLIEALPPATDYLTYLTIIEYNLNPENLSTLHEVLQDTKLTTSTKLGRMSPGYRATRKPARGHSQGH